MLARHKLAQQGDWMMSSTQRVETAPCRVRALRFVSSLWMLVAIGCSADAAPSCMELGNAARSLVAAAIAESDLSCADDAECMFASNDTACSGACGVLVNRAGARALADAIGQANRTVCDRDRSCVALALPCIPPPGLGLASCIEGTCQSVPPPSWDSFTITQQMGPNLTVSIPPRCAPQADCTLWALTPDAIVMVTKHGQLTTRQMSAADFATVDGILRSLPLRKLDSTAVATCDPPPSGQDVSITLSRSGPTTGRDITGCVLGGPADNVWSQLYAVVTAY